MIKTQGMFDENLNAVRGRKPSQVRQCCIVEYWSQALRIWQKDDYVTHEAICPACGRGGRFRSRKGYTDLRVRFEPGEARSLDRKIIEMRIKCGDSQKYKTGLPAAMVSSYLPSAC